MRVTSQMDTGQLLDREKLCSGYGMLRSREFELGSRCFVER